MHLQPKYQQFIFEDYSFNPHTKTLNLRYSLDGILQFCETYRFDFDFADYDDMVLQRSLETLFFMAGVSYFKTYIPQNIVVRTGILTSDDAAFFSKTYQRGLGEFWYVNKLDPRTAIDFPTNSPEVQPTLLADGDGLLVGLGGGKDSLLTIEMLSSAKRPLTTWALGHKAQLQPLVDAIGLPHLSVERTLDRQLLELNAADAYNGHVPISAIFAAVGTVVAVLSGRRDCVVSNESAANEPTLEYQGVAINHQYSKSQEFERDYQSYLTRHYGESLRYYSFLRPLSELRIAELFAASGFSKYAGVFSSCNRAFAHDSQQMYWCGNCPKCAFVFLILTPFIGRSDVEKLWRGKNLLLDPQLQPVYRQLLGIQGDKPLECVGEIQESRTAMKLTFNIYPELIGLYSFDIPDSYDYRQIITDEMPTEIRQIFMDSLQRLQVQPPPAPLE